MAKLTLHAHPRPRDVERMVLDHVGSWKLQNPPAEREMHWPVITISRQVETGAEQLGQRLADQLGFAFWDANITTSIAQGLHTRPTSITALDEHARTAVDDFVATAFFGQHATTPDYLEQLRQLVTAIDRRGSAVIIGRGAQCIVNPETSFRVRVVGSLQSRIARLRARTGLGERAARRAVRADDKDRAGFVRRTFGVDAADPANYDLVVNTDIRVPERAAALVLAAYVTKYGRPRSSVRAAS